MKRRCLCVTTYIDSWRWAVWLRKLWKIAWFLHKIRVSCRRLTSWALIAMQTRLSPGMLRRLIRACSSWLRVCEVLLHVRIHKLTLYFHMSLNIISSNHLRTQVSRREERDYLLINDIAMVFSINLIKFPGKRKLKKTFNERQLTAKQLSRIYVSSHQHNIYRQHVQRRWINGE